MEIYPDTNKQEERISRIMWNVEAAMYGFFDMTGVSRSQSGIDIIVE